jgi:hypothetical protein
VPHFRLPAIAHGIVSFLWGLFLGGYIWLGLLAIGIPQGTSFIVAAVSGCAIFVFVRIYGEELPRRRSGRTR